MIHFIVLDENNVITGAGSMPNVESVESNIKQGSTWMTVLDEAVIGDIANYYWSNKLNSLEKIPTCPQGNGVYSFDVRSEQWVDTTPVVTLDDYRKEALAQLKTKYTNIELGGFEYLGKVVQSNLISQQRMLSTVVDGNIDWITADNTTLTLTNAQFDEMKIKLSNHIQDTITAYNAAKQAMLSAVTKSDIEDILNA